MNPKDIIVPDTSWLHGEYNASCGKVEINTKIPHVSIEGFFNDGLQDKLGGDLFTQGEEAMFIIEDIHSYWVAGNLTQIQAIEKYINNYGY